MSSSWSLFSCGIALVLLGSYSTTRAQSEPCGEIQFPVPSGYDPNIFPESMTTQFSRDQLAWGWFNTTQQRFEGFLVQKHGQQGGPPLRSVGTLGITGPVHLFSVPRADSPNSLHLAYLIPPSIHVMEVHPGSQSVGIPTMAAIAGTAPKGIGTFGGDIIIFALAADQQLHATRVGGLGQSQFLAEHIEGPEWYDIERGSQGDQFVVAYKETGEVGTIFTDFWKLNGENFISDKTRQMTVVGADFGPPKMTLLLNQQDNVLAARMMKNDPFSQLCLQFLGSFESQRCFDAPGELIDITPWRQNSVIVAVQAPDTTFQYSLVTFEETINIITTFTSPSGTSIAMGQVDDGFIHIVQSSDIMGRCFQGPIVMSLLSAPVINGYRESENRDGDSNNVVRLEVFGLSNNPGVEQTPQCEIRQGDKFFDVISFSLQNPSEAGCPLEFDSLDSEKDISIILQPAINLAPIVVRLFLDNGEGDFIVGIVVVVGGVLCVCCTVGIAFALIRARRNKRKKTRKEKRRDSSSLSEEEMGTQRKHKSKKNEASTEELLEENEIKITMESQANGADPFEINYSELVLGKELGRGNFGIVYKAEWRNADCVAKQMLFKGNTDKMRVAFMKEIKMMQNLRAHPHVVQTLGACTSPNTPMCIVTEYCSGGNLEDKLFDPLYELGAYDAVVMAKQVASGMSHLHQENMLHCDLAARNILVSKAGVKVADFGMSHNLESDTYEASVETQFPVRWSSPEVLQTHKWSKVSDVWSFGVLLYEIFERKRPYHRKTNAEVIDFVTAEKGHCEKPTLIEYPEEVWEIMQSCFLAAPKRPDFMHIYAHFNALVKGMEAALDEKPLVSQVDKSVDISHYMRTPLLETDSPSEYVSPPSVSGYTNGTELNADAPGDSGPPPVSGEYTSPPESSATMAEGSYESTPQSIDS